MTFFGATTLMTVNLVEVTSYFCALFTSPPGMSDVGIRLIGSVQHLYFIVSAPALFLPLGIVLISSRIIPRVLGYLALALGGTFAFVGIASLHILALPPSITSLGSIQALWWLAAAFSLLFRSGRVSAIDQTEDK
jgi:hypothetical protein